MMDTETAEKTLAQQDNLYRRGMTHLQSGEWEAAIECFESLRQHNPESEEIEGLLDKARFKAELDAETSVRPRRWAVRWRGVVAWTLAALAVVAVAFEVTRFVQSRVLPGVTAVQEAQRQAQLLEEGREFLAEGNLEAAEERFRLLKEAVPQHTEAEQGLNQIAEIRELQDIYGRGVAAQEEGNLAAALDAFRKIASRSPGYEDVDERIADIEGRLELEDVFAEANRAYEDGRTLDALAAYRQVRRMNVSYERDLVETRLFELYMKTGRDIIRQPRPEALPQAIDYFVQALALQPSSQDANRENRMAGTCLEGLNAYDEGDWGRAIGRLRVVFDDRPEYLGGEVAETLYVAYVRLGDAYEAAGNFQLAYEQYQKAMDLPVDRSLASTRINWIVPLLTPTPTPTPLPTGTPEPTPRPFTGNVVQEDRNLLTNASFEGGWYDTYTGQVPDGWRCLWLDGVGFPGSADIAFTPETTIQQISGVPQRERGTLFRDGRQSLKVFKAYAPIYAAVVQDVSGLDVGRSYQLVVPIFVDVFSWEGEKVAPSGEAAQIRLGAAPTGAAWRDETAVNYSDWWNGLNTANFYLEYSDYVFEFEATEPQMTIYIEMAGIYGMSNNGFFIDNTALYPIGARTRP